MEDIVSKRFANTSTLADKNDASSATEIMNNNYLNENNNSFKSGLDIEIEECMNILDSESQSQVTNLNCNEEGFMLRPDFPSSIPDLLPISPSEINNTDNHPVNLNSCFELSDKNLDSLSSEVFVNIDYKDELLHENRMECELEKNSISEDNISTASICKLSLNLKPEFDANNENSLNANSLLMTKTEEPFNLDLNSLNKNSNLVEVMSIVKENNTLSSSNIVLNASKSSSLFYSQICNADNANGCHVEKINGILFTEDHKILLDKSSCPSKKLKYDISLNDHASYVTIIDDEETSNKTVANDHETSIEAITDDQETSNGTVMDDQESSKETVAGDQETSNEAITNDQETSNGTVIDDQKTPNKTVTHDPETSNGTAADDQETINETVIYDQEISNGLVTDNLCKHELKDDKNIKDNLKDEKDIINLDCHIDNVEEFLFTEDHKTFIDKSKCHKTKSDASLNNNKTSDVTVIDNQKRLHATVINNQEPSDATVTDNQTTSNGTVTDNLCKDDLKDGIKLKDYLDEEKDDLINPKWDSIKKLTTNEQRYQQVRKCWGSRKIPDPNKNLTYHSYRKRLLSSNCPPIVTRHKRQASSQLNEKSAKRQCTFVLDEEIDTVERKKEKDKQVIIDEMYHKINCINYQGSTWQNVSRVSMIKNEYYNIVDVCEDNYKDKIFLLNERRKEVLQFYGFYKGLNDSNEDPTQLTESQFQELNEIEDVYRQFNIYYSD